MADAAKTELNRERARRLIFVVLVFLVAWSSIVSQITSNRLEATTERVQSIQKTSEKERQCSKTVLFSLVVAVNERTTYTGAQAKANKDLQLAQADFIKARIADDPPGQSTKDALEKYFKALGNFNALVNKTSKKTAQYKYPTEDQYSDCLAEARKGNS